MDIKCLIPSDCLHSTKEKLIKKNKTILNFLQKLRSIENILLEIIQLNLESESFFYNMWYLAQVIQSYQVSRNNNFVISSLLCLNVHRIKIVLGQKTLKYIQETLKNLGCLGGLEELRETTVLKINEDKSKRSIIDKYTCDNTPGQMADKKIQIPKLVLVKPPVKFFFDFNHLGERKIGKPI